MSAPMQTSAPPGQVRLHALAVDVSGALNLVGWLVKYLSPAFLFPTAIALGYGEASWPFLVAGAITLGCGLALQLATTGRERIGAREGYLVVALIWILIAVFGALPYLLAEPQLSRPVDAMFESMSGFSTTGSSVLTHIDALPRSMAMWRQFTTWIGGVGIIVLFLAVLPRLRIGGRQALFRTESRSIEPFAPVTQWAFVVFMVIAGTNFALMYASIIGRSLRVFGRDEEFRVYVLVLALTSAIVIVNLADQGIFEGADAARHGIFQIASMMTTTGFATADFNHWTSLTALVLFGVIMVSASAGSTSGSIKLVRHVVIAKLLRRELDQTLHPHRVAPLRVNGVVVDERALRAIIVFVFLYLGVLVAGAAAILIDCSLRDIPLTAFDSLADAATTLGGVGPGLGFAGPMGSFAPFSDLSTVVLTALMYLGRLEIIPVLVIFTRSHWRA
jgi:Trk-type K+ transport system membrane component